MTQTDLRVPFRCHRPFLLFGLAVIAVSLILGSFSWDAFFRAYLVGYLLWSGVAFGALVLLAIHHLAGGGWGYLIRRILEAATRTWAIVILLFVPVLAGIPWLYAWSDAQAIRESPVLAAKQIYLNTPAFVVRAAVFFAVFVLVTILLQRTSSEQDASEDPDLVRRLQNISGPGLLVFVLCLSFVLIDWAMSLQAEWFSTMFSPMLIVGQVVSALAVAIVTLSFVGHEETLAPLLKPKYILDLGNMFLAFLMLWAYLQFSQLLIVWSGNLSEEIPWYLSRIEGGWQAVSLILAILHFAVPFALLLGRRNKSDLRVLSHIAVLVLVLRVLASIWIVEPAFHLEGFTFQVLDWLLSLGIGGVWLAFFAGELQAMPLVPLKDPRLHGVLVRLVQPRVGDVRYE